MSSALCESCGSWWLIGPWVSAELVVKTSSYTSCSKSLITELLKGTGWLTWSSGTPPIPIHYWWCSRVILLGTPLKRGVCWPQWPHTALFALLIWGWGGEWSFCFIEKLTRRFKSLVLQFLVCFCCCCHTGDQTQGPASVSQVFCYWTMCTPNPCVFSLLAKFCSCPAMPNLSHTVSSPSSKAHDPFL